MTRVAATFAAALCACLLLLLPSAALAGSGTCGPASSPVVAEANDFDESHAGIDVADRPELAGVAARHVSRKPRRSHRRLRIRNRAWLQSASAPAQSRTAEMAEVKLKRKRHKTKRSLMRLLIAVRGGLQA